MIYKLSVVVFTLLLLNSCSSISYWSDLPGDIDYSDYQSYMIDDQCSDYDPGVNPINQQRIKNALELELRAMGFIRSDDPDLNVKFFIKNETKYFYENCANEYDDITGGNQCIERVYSYEEGTLIVDFIDLRNNLAVWHGGARGESWDTVKNPDATIKQMVKQLLKEFKSLRQADSYAMN